MMTGILSAKWVLLSAHLTEQSSKPIGILLVDAQRDELLVKVTDDWQGVSIDEQEAEIWRELAAELEEQGRQMGGAYVLDWLENTASHALRIGEVHDVQSADKEATLEDLYGRHVLLRQGECEDNPNIKRSMAALSITDLKRKPAASKWSLGMSPREPWVHVVLAATFILTAVLAGRYANLRQPMTPELKASDSRLVFTENRYQPSLSNVESVWQSAHSGHRRRKVRKPAVQVHKAFRAEVLDFRPLPRRLVLMEPPPPVLVDYTSLLVLWTSPLPELPAFRPRRNLLVRIFTAIAAPFRSRKPETVSQSAFI
jgi:hypothetical protein